jgi:hypothetical protein
MNLKRVIGGFHQARWPPYAFDKILPFDKILLLLRLPSLDSQVDVRSCNASQNDRMEKSGRIQQL